MVQGRMSADMARAWAVCSGPSTPGMLAFAGSVVPTAQPFEFIVLFFSGFSRLSALSSFITLTLKAFF